MTASKWLSEISSARDYFHQPQRTAQYHFQHWPMLMQTSPAASTPSARLDSFTGSRNSLNVATDICWGKNSPRSPQCSELSSSLPPIEFEMSYWDCSPESDQPPGEYDLRPWASADYSCAAETIPSVRDARKEVSEGNPTHSIHTLTKPSAAASRIAWHSKPIASVNNSHSIAYGPNATSCGRRTLDSRSS